MAEETLYEQTKRRGRLWKRTNGANGTNGPNGYLSFSASTRRSPSLIRVLPEPVQNGTVLEGVRKKVFLDRYSLKDEEGNPLEEYPEQMWRRVARAIAQVEETAEKRQEWEEKFYRAMEDFKFVPGGRILSGAGTGFAVTYYNCYVLPSPKDSRDGILDNLKEMIEIMARGGGVGINLSSLRPRGARVKKVNGFSSGPMNWAELHSIATREIVQQGGTRRGALMLMLWDWHPDVEEFITVKKDLNRIQGANLSVCVSDKFMKALKNDEDWDLVFPDLDDPEYDEKWDGILQHWLDAGKKVKVHKTIKARYLWDLICEAAWASAEPGVVFMERYNKWHNNYYFNYINCVNPCGEEGLPPYGVCNLGSLNLSNFVTNDGEMDYESLAEHAKVAVRFQDNVIDGDIYVLPGIVEAQLNGERRIGLGTMGLGDALIKMKLRYGSDEALPVIEKIYRTIRDAAYEASSDIAREKGAFPKFDAGKHLQGHFIKRLPKRLRTKIKKNGIRNSVLLMQAPTGSTSLLSGTTSGIEPVYEFSFIRRDRLGEHKIYHHLYDKWRENNPGKEKPAYFVSANDLSPEDHVRVQAAVQKYVDASISKTVNAPKDHTVDDVKRLYTLAYELGCKGITYMRDGSRPGVLSREEKGEHPLADVVGNTKKKEEKQDVNQAALAPRPEKAVGATYRIMTPMGAAFITINEDERGEPLEVFVNIGHAGSDITALAEALGRIISTSLRFRGDLAPKERAREIADQLGGIGGRRSVGFGPNKVRSLPDAVALALSRYFGFKVNGNGSTQRSGGTETHRSGGPQGPGTNMQAGAVMAAHNPDPTPAPAALDDSLNGEREAALTSVSADICPECGAVALVHEEGCAKCYACGHAEC